MARKTAPKKTAPNPAAPAPTPKVASTAPAVPDLSELRDPALEAAVVAAPDDRATWLVYADWLQSKGHPLGELITLSIAAEDEPPRQRKLKVRATALLTRIIEERHVPRYPLLAQRMLAFKLGPVERGSDGIGDSASASIRWRRGFIDSIGTWCWTQPMRDQGLALLRDPHALLLRSLSLRDEELADLRWVAHLGALETLELRWAKLHRLTDLAPLAGLPRLCWLDLRGAPVSDLAPLRALPLRKLLLQGSAVTDLQPLAGHPLLEQLDLSGTPVTDVSPLLACPRLCNVSLWDARVPAAQAEELKRAMKASGASPSPGSDYEPYLSHADLNWYD